jgi:hypothetical protein
MNRQTANYLLANTNAADLGGKRTNGLANILSMGEVNTLLTGEGLPNIAVYDKGYKNDSNVFTRFLPNNKVVVVGVRPNNAPVAEYWMTRNANNPDLGPGPYSVVADTMDEKKPPRYDLGPRRAQRRSGHILSRLYHHPFGLTGDRLRSIFMGRATQLSCRPAQQEVLTDGKQVHCYRALCRPTQPGRYHRRLLEVRRPEP